MLTDAILAWLHFALIFALVSVLTLELVSLRYCDRAETLLRLPKIDLVYVLLAILVLASGLARMFIGIKGSGFYLGTWLFHLKMTLFVLVGLLSIVPTFSFMRWRKALQANPAFLPAAAEISRTKIWLHAELTVVLLIPLVASLMARGFGRIVH